MVGKYRKGSHGLYIMSKDNIDDEAESILNEYCKDCLSEPKKIDIEYLIECMGIDLCYVKLSKNSEILGACVFNEGMLTTYNDNKPENRMFPAKTIIIDSQIAERNDARLKFTYGHELGHYVVQYDIFHVNENQISLFEYESSKVQNNAAICKRENIMFDTLLNKHKKLETKEDWQEWQANYFSSSILIPKVTLKIALKQFLDDYDIMSQDCVLDKLEKSRLKELIDKLATIYEVSSKMMENRLKSLNYLS